jgi:hypothetical protein
MHILLLLSLQRENTHIKVYIERRKVHNKRRTYMIGQGPRDDFRGGLGPLALAARRAGVRAERLVAPLPLLWRLLWLLELLLLLLWLLLTRCGGREAGRQAQEEEEGLEERGRSSPSSSAAGACHPPRSCVWVWCVGACLCRAAHFGGAYVGVSRSRRSGVFER